MNGLSNKIIGWALIAGGILMILWMILTSYNIFIGTKEAPKIFRIEGQSQAQECLTTADKLTNNKQVQEMEEQVKKIIEGQIKEQIKEFFPPEFIAKILNLGAWSLFAWLVFLAGGRISSIGIKLIRNKAE